MFSAEPVDHVLLNFIMKRIIPKGGVITVGTSTSASNQTLIPVKSEEILVIPGSQAGDKVRQPRFPILGAARVACSDDESEPGKVSFLDQTLASHAAPRIVLTSGDRGLELGRWKTPHG